MYSPHGKHKKTLTYYKPLYKKNKYKSAYTKNNYKPKLLIPSKWQTKLKSSYVYPQKDIKRKTLPHWLVRSVNKNFIESKAPWIAYYNLPERSARHRKHRSYRYKVQLWYKRKSKKLKRKKVYSLFGFTNYVYRLLDRTQYPRTNLLRRKIDLHKRWHNKMIKLRLRLPDELCRLLKPWKYNYLPPTLLRGYIKQRYKRFYKIIGADTKYKLKFLRTFKGEVLKNSAIKKLNSIWKKLFWYRKRSHRKKNRPIRSWRAWLSTLWGYRTGIFYNQLFFYKKKKIKRFITFRRPHLFRSYKKDQLNTPWRDALIFKRYLYINNVTLVKYTNRKSVKPAIRSKNPLYEKKNKIFYWLYQLVNNRRAEFIQKNKKLRIKHVLRKIILSFYGNLKTKQFQYLVKRCQVSKSTILTKRENLLKKLELRLDVLVYRLNLAPSIYWAQQFIKCGHIYISSTNKLKDWQRMYQALWITSFSSYLRDPKYMYSSQRWLHQLPLLDYKVITLPITQWNYIVQPGTIIYTSPNSCLNKFKHSNQLFKKIIPAHLITTTNLKLSWSMKCSMPTAKSTTFWQKEYKHPLASLVLFNPTFSDLAINDRIKYDSIEWIVL